MDKVPPLKSPINEDSIEQACISWFEQLGYTAVRPVGAVVSQSVKTDILENQLYRINPHITESEVAEVIQAVTDLGDDKTLFSRNRTAHNMLINGVKVIRLVGDEEQTHIVHITDFNTPENNDFSVVSQLSVQGRFEKRRPDLIIYMNGLPVSVIELKNPTNESATLDKAYNQIQTYQSQIDDIFTFNVVNVLSDGMQTGVGSITADFSRYHAWRKDEHGNESHWQLENLVNGLFAPALFLDYMRYFVIFEQPSPDTIIKKVAGYHQFYGVRRAVVASMSAYTNKTGKSGVFWHTQGSGKSISMVFYVAKLRAKMNNPTFVIVTDRSDLDRQLYQTFQSAYDIIGHTAHANSRNDLREYLNARLSGGILFTTVQKFALIENEDTFPKLNDRNNIVVMADEAHRSQYGHIKKYNADRQKYTYGASQHMHDAMPNANFIGFTGTPIDLDDRSTQAVFGDYVDIYDINDAVQDKATVELYYEGRLVKLHQSEKISEVDDFVDDMVDTTNPENEKAKRKWSAIAQVAGTPDRMQKSPTI